MWFMDHPFALTYQIHLIATCNFGHVFFVVYQTLRRCVSLRRIILAATQNCQVCDQSPHQLLLLDIQTVFIGFNKYRHTFNLASPKIKRYKLLTCYQYAWNYKVDVIILGTPPYVDCKRDVRIRLGTAHVNDLISLRREINQIPFSVGDVLLCVTFLSFQYNVQSVTIVCPRAELHRTKLNKKVIIKGERVKSQRAGLHTA